MIDKKYKFSVDESRPQIPPPRDFSSLLSGVKAQIPWYAKSIFWGGAATVAVTTAAVAWWFQIPTGEREPVAIEQSNAAIERVEGPASSELSTIAEAPAFATYGRIPAEGGSVQNELRALYPQNAEIASIEHFMADNIAQVVPAVPRMGIFAGWKFRLKYDTIKVNTYSLPAQFDLARGSKLYIPEGALVGEDGEPVNGEVLVLYREFLDQADMLAHSMYLEGQIATGAAPMVNNGAFEILLQHEGQAVKIEPKNPLLMQYITLDGALVFSGFHARAYSDIWKPMFFNTIASNAESNPKKLVTDRMTERRSFFGWLDDIFHGRKVGWDTFERVEPQYFDYGVYDRSRTFEIAETGFFASGRTMETGFSALGKLNVHCQNKERLETRLYQVFLNSNMVREYELVEGKTAVQYSSNDRCMLIAIVENTNFIAVLDANSFDRLVKGQVTEADITLRLWPEEIKSIHDLKAVIKSYGSQRPRKL
jgi:hypothetical protein